MVDLLLAHPLSLVDGDQLLPNDRGRIAQPLRSHEDPCHAALLLYSMNGAVEKAVIVGGVAVVEGVVVGVVGSVVVVVVVAVEEVAVGVVGNVAVVDVAAFANALLSVVDASQSCVCPLTEHRL